MSRPLLCETVTGSTLAELRAARDAASGADMVELRLDGVGDLDVAGALQGRTTPVVVTCRPSWEGGRFDGAEETRKRVLTEALALGADYVDVEWRAGWDDLIRSTGGRRIVLSNHDFSGVPSDLASRHRAMRSTGAEVVKLAAAVVSLSDTLALRPLAADGGSIVIGMGPAGVVTRLLAAHFGSRWTYAGQGVASGQMPASEMRKRFRFNEVSLRTAIYGVAGNPILHSRSPTMHNAAFSAAGIDAVYVPLEASDADDFLAFADAMPVAGASVTIPFKVDVMGKVLEVDRDGQTVGAVNTLRRSNGGWAATNTDMGGFLAPLARQAQHHGWSITGARVAVLGAGGAARAAVAGLLGAGARVTVHARRIEQARVVATGLGASVGEWPPAAGSWDVLVNCTPLGGLHQPESSPLPGGPFEGRLVYDLIYSPRETRLLSEAAAAGCEVLGGLEMLVAQAEQQFAWWTGRPPPTGVMSRAVGLVGEDA
jgi:3-dehydroquinate dehydratase/shikimate dehydrogenase